MRSSIFFRKIGLLLLVTMVSGCAGRQAFRHGEELYRQGEYDAAVAKYFQAVQAEPDSYEFRMRLQNARNRAAIDHFANGRRLVRQGDFPQALREFEQAAALDPTHETARQEASRTKDFLRADELVAEAGRLYAVRKFQPARNAVEEALALHPDNQAAQELLASIQAVRQTVLDGVELDVASEKPITLKFKDADVRDVFNIVSKLSGINFIFDEDIRAQKMSILLEDATFAQALELLLRLNNLERKILNAKTILIFPQTKEKGKKYDDHIIQTFYLSNIDAKKAVNLLRTMLQLRKIYVHEELNALVIRDTTATVKLAQQILEAADRSDSEVVYELELIEVTHTDSLDLGTSVDGTPNTIAFGLVQPGEKTIGTVTTSGLSRLEFLYTIPSARFNFEKNKTDSEILANPKIRVKNKEKAKVHIGSREPIITNTLTAAGDVTSTNVQYVDVGVKLDIEPTIQLDNSVVTKISLEVSNVADRVKLDNGGEALTISTTNAQTALLLKDGEQTIIGGLMRDDFTRARESIPLLGDLPLIGELISGHSRKKIKREILLSVTPHIVKNLQLPRAEVATIWSGGEDDLQTTPRFGAFVTKLQAEPEQAAPIAVPAQAPVEQRTPPTLPAPPAAEIPDVPPPLAPAPVASPETSPMPPPAGAEPFSSSPSASRGASKDEPELFFTGGDAAAIGEEVALEVRVRGVAKLHSAPLIVKYEESHLEFLRAEEGTFLGSAGAGTVFSAGQLSPGELMVGYRQETDVTRAGVSGEGLLFRLVFRGLAPGTARVALERMDFRDPSGLRLDLSGDETLVDVR